MNKLFNIIYLLFILMYLSTCDDDLSEATIYPCIEINNCNCGESVIDIRNDEEYGTTWIDSLGGNDPKVKGQCWMTRNLAFGDLHDSSSYSFFLDSTIQRFYNSNSTLGIEKVGGYYLQDEAFSETKEFGLSLCPDGWKVPSQEDFEFLKNSIKDSGSRLLFSGDNTLKFSGRKLGNYSTSPSPDEVINFGRTMFLWTSTNNGSNANTVFYMDDNNNILIHDQANTTSANCIRCIKE